MQLPLLFACPLCTLDTPEACFLSLALGGVLVSHWLLRPLVSRVARRWGWPRPSLACWASLLPILAWPAVFCWIGLQSHGVPLVAACTAGLVACALYLWLRGVWLLEQCHVASRTGQFLFLGFLGPGMLVAGGLVGRGIVGLLWLGVLWPSQAIPWFLVHAGLGTGIGAVIAVLLHRGVPYVFHTQGPVTSDTAS
jgi:hypothetical protein